MCHPKRYPAKVNTIYCRVSGDSSFEVPSSVIKLAAQLQAFTQRKTQIRAARSNKLLFTFAPKLLS